MTVLVYFDTGKRVDAPNTPGRSPTKVRRKLVRGERARRRGVWVWGLGM